MANVSAAHADIKAAESIQRGLARVVAGTDEIAQRLFLADPSLRDWEWRYLFAELNPSVKTFWLPWRGGVLSMTGPVYRPMPTSGATAFDFTGAEDVQLSLSNDGRQLWLRDGTDARSWDVSRGSATSIAGPAIPAPTLAIDSSGRLMAQASDKHHRLIEAATGLVSSTLSSSRPDQAAFSPESEWVATADTDQDNPSLGRGERQASSTNASRRQGVVPEGCRSRNGGRVPGRRRRARLADRPPNTADTGIGFRVFSIVCRVRPRGRQPCRRFVGASPPMERPQRRLEVRKSGRGRIREDPGLQR